MWRWVAATVAFWSVVVLFHSALNPDLPLRTTPVTAAPPVVAPAHLQLWLTADQGVTCEEGTVTTWSDLSGHFRDALSGWHKGPECHAPRHALAGVDLPYFSAPGDKRPYVDGTLELDLEFLTRRDFTIFVVERRWADGPRENGPNEELLGADSGGDLHWCRHGSYLLNLGYAYEDGSPKLSSEIRCRPWSGTSGPAPSRPTPPAQVKIDMLRLARAEANYPTVWQNGVMLDVRGASDDLNADFIGGSIGRAFEDRFDNRFRGDIAEIVIYDAALTDGQIRAIEAYFRQHWRL
jgi:hypothetical protein